MHKLYLIWEDFAAKMKKQNIGAHAANIAFFFFLSIVPMLMVICMILPYTPLTEQNLMELAADIAPEKLEPLLESLIANVYDKSAGSLSVAVIATLWSAARGVMALMNGLNAVNGVEEKRNYFIVRGMACFYTVVMLLVVILSLLLNVFGNRLVDFALHRIPQLQKIVSFAMNFRFIVVWAVLTLVFAMIYAYVPSDKLKLREQIPGATFAAVVWNIFSWGFSIYVDYGNPYGIYGSLSIIIIALLWMYFCMYIIMVGAYLNCYFKPVNQVLAGTHR